MVESDPPTVIFGEILYGTRCEAIRASKRSFNVLRRSHLLNRAGYSSARLAGTGCRSGQKATTARATMIPTETSMNRWRATIHAGLVRGIKTMIVRVTLA